MKNLPDDELFRKLQDDLRSFEEEPDEDVWERIAGAIPRREPTWSKWADRTALTLALLLFAGVIYEDRKGSPDRESSPVHGLHDPATAPDQSPVTRALTEDAAAVSKRPKPSADASQAATGEERHAHNGSAGEQGTPAATQTPDASHHAPALHRNQNGMRDTERPGRQQGTYATSIPSESAHPNADHAMPHQELQQPSSGSSVVDHANGNPSPGKPAILPLTEPQAGNGSERDIADERRDTPATAAADSALAMRAADSVGHASPETIIKPAPRKTRTLRMYIAGTPSLTFQQVTPSTSDDVSFLRLNSPGVLATERLSMSFETGIQVPVAKRLVLLTGLTWYQQSHKISLDQAAEGESTFIPAGDLRFAVVPGARNTTVNYSMRNIGITAGLAYAISVRKLVHQFGASLQYEMGLKNGSPETYDNASATYLNYRIFYRVEYAVNERVGVFVQPAFGRSLRSDVALDGAIRVKQTHAGVGFGALYRF